MSRLALRFCPRHWEALTKAIDDRGLSGLTLRRGAEECSYLVGAYCRIVANLVPFVDFTSAGAGIVCPLCSAQGANDAHQKTCADPECKPVNFDTWIVLAADGALDEAKAVGLVGAA